MRDVSVYTPHWPILKGKKEKRYHKFSTTNTAWHSNYQGWWWFPLAHAYNNCTHAWKTLNKVDILWILLIGFSLEVRASCLGWPPVRQWICACHFCCSWKCREESYELGLHWKICCKTAMNHESTPRWRMANALYFHCKSYISKMVSHWKIYLTKQTKTKHTNERTSNLPQE